MKSITANFENLLAYIKLMYPFGRFDWSGLIWFVKYFESCSQQNGCRVAKPSKIFMQRLTSFTLLSLTKIVIAWPCLKLFFFWILLFYRPCWLFILIDDWLWIIMFSGECFISCQTRGNMWYQIQETELF